MSKLDDIKIKKLIHSIGLKYNLSDEVVKKIVESPYEFSREKFKELNLDDIETEEEFEKTKTNFMYPSFFKLVTDYYTVKTRKKYKNKYKK